MSQCQGRPTCQTCFKQFGNAKSLSVHKSKLKGTCAEPMSDQEFAFPQPSVKGPWKVYCVPCKCDVAERHTWNISRNTILNLGALFTSGTSTLTLTWQRGEILDDWSIFQMHQDKKVTFERTAGYLQPVLPPPEEEPPVGESGAVELPPSCFPHDTYVLQEEALVVASASVGDPAPSLAGGDPSSPECFFDDSHTDDDAVNETLGRSVEGAGQSVPEAFEELARPDNPQSEIDVPGCDVDRR